MSQKSADIVNFEEVKLLSGGANSDALIIDVREPDELKETGVIPRSINIPCNFLSVHVVSNIICMKQYFIVGQLEHVLKDLDNEAFKKKYAHAKPDQDSRIIFSCRSGRRSAEAATIAHKLGYSRYLMTLRVQTVKLLLLVFLHFIQLSSIVI